MIELHLPWLDFMILLLIVGAIWVALLRDRDRVRRHSLVISGLALICALGAWWDFAALQTFEAHERWDLLGQFFHRDVLVIDEFSAPLVPLTALLYLLTELATLRTKVQRFSFASTLISEAILIGTLTSKLPWVIVALLVVGTVPPLVELQRRKKPTRVYTLHMAVFSVLLVVGQAWVDRADGLGQPAVAAILILTLAVLLRCGAIPLHCWMTDLFEHASFGTALLFVTPMVGEYAVMRLVLPIAPGWVLRSIAMISLTTAVYAAGMALVQREARRFFTYLYLSHSSLVLVGLELATPIGLTGGLCVWFSVGLSLTGFGLTLRCVEARTGRLSLDGYHGLYDKVPVLASFFLLTGLASIGFPGTIGFVGTELLVDGAGQVSAWVETLIVVATALNGLAVLHAYFRVFTGSKHPATIDLRSRFAERVSVLVLTLLIIGGGLYPQPGVASRYHAAVELIGMRDRMFSNETRPAQAAAQSPLEKETPGAATHNITVRSSRQALAETP